MKFFFFSQRLPRSILVFSRSSNCVITRRRWTHLQGVVSAVGGFRVEFHRRSLFGGFRVEFQQTIRLRDCCGSVASGWSLSHSSLYGGFREEFLQAVRTGADQPVRNEDSPSIKGEDITTHRPSWPAAAHTPGRIAARGGDLSK